MTVREAAQSIISLTGAQSICACRAGGGGQSLAEGAMMALNRAMQEVWAAPSSRHMTLEPVTVTYTSGPATMSADVLKVVGPVRWNGMAPIPLATNETDFQNFFRDYVDEHFDDVLWDDLVFGSQHNVTGGFPWYTVEFYMPLVDDRAILVYFDNAANVNTLNPEATASPRGNPINSRTILIRVELPHADTAAATCRALVLWELRKMASQFLEFEERGMDSAIRCYRRRPADVSDWVASTTAGVSLSVTKGPRIPQIAWAEEMKDTTALVEDTAKIRLHLLPPAAGSVSVKVQKEPPKYTLADLDCDGDGFNSTVIALAHGWAESLVMPLARLAFAQDYPAYLTPQTAASLPALEAAGSLARETLGLSAPASSQHLQRNQTTTHAHP